jgi:hypothetical protein
MPICCKGEEIVRKMKTVRMLCIMVGSILAAFLVPLAARAWLASPRPVKAPVQAAVWGPYRQFISDNGYDSGMHFYPALAAMDPTVCAAWSQQVGYDSEHYDPYYTSSPQQGEIGQWEGRFNIHNTWPITTETTRVDVAVDSGGELHFVWSEYTQTPSYTLYYSSTHISGNVIEEITFSNDALLPAMAVSDDKVHVVWAQGWGRINYIERGSGAWDPLTIVNIISSTQRATHPAIEVGSDGIVHIVWSGGAIDQQADIFYKNSSSNWSTPPLELFNETNVGGRSPAMAVSGSNVYVVWCEYVSEGEQYIRFRQSEGGSWGPSERISGAPLAANQDSPNWLRPTIAVDINGKIHLAFNGAGAVSDPEDIYYAYKKPGEDWRCCENVTQSDANDTTPAIATGGQYVHLIWAGPPSVFDEEHNDYEVVYKRADIEAEMDREDLYLPLIMKSAS